MHHAYRNKPLSARQELANKLISKKRYIVEQCFGTVKVNAQVMLKSICMNLKKAVNKIFVDKPPRGVVRPNAA